MYVLKYEDFFLQCIKAAELLYSHFNSKFINSFFKQTTLQKKNP